jgi:hypothetical protein
MKKVLIYLLLLIANVSNAQKMYEELDPEIIQEDTTMIVENITEDTTKTFYHYRISFNDVNTKFDSGDLQTDMTEMFKTKTEFNEIIKQFVFVSTEDVEEYTLRTNLSNHQLTYFKKIIIITK